MRIRFPTVSVSFATAAVLWLSAVQVALAQSDSPDILAAFAYRYAQYYLPYAIQSAAVYQPVEELNGLRAKVDATGYGADAGYAVQSAVVGQQYEDLRNHARKIFKPWQYQFGSEAYLTCIDPADSACQTAYQKRGWDFGSGPTYQVWARTRAERGACSEVSIAFRGTVGLSGGDWFSNLSRFGSPYDDYYHQLQRNVDAIIRQIQNLDCYRRAGRKPQIVSTGHSLGGGLAQFVALATRSHGPRIAKVIAFDPSPVTGAHLVANGLRNENVRGLVIDRVYESGEVLSYARGLVQEYPQASSRCNPQVRTVEVKAARGTAIGLHGVTLLATNLVDLAYNDGEPVGYRAPATVSGGCDVIYRPDTDEQLVAHAGGQRFAAEGRRYARNGGRIAVAPGSASERSDVIARFRGRKSNGEPAARGTTGAGNAFALAAGDALHFTPLQRAE